MLANYTTVGSTGADDQPILELVTQTARETENGLVLIEEDDHYNQEGRVGGPYRSLTSLKRAAARRRARLSVKEGEYEQATAAYEERMKAEDTRIQTEVDAVAAQGIDALWAALGDDSHRNHSEKLGLAILEKLGVAIEEPKRVSSMCGHRSNETAPTELEEVKAPGPYHGESGAYRYKSPRGSYSRQVVSWDGGGGPLVFVYGECRRDPGLTTDEGMTSFEVYGSSGSWFQFRDFGFGNTRGCKFV